MMRDVPRYEAREEQQRAVQEDCRRRYQELFGQPWDPECLADWREWLAPVATADAKAKEVLGNLVDALDVARRYFAAQSVPSIEQRETREGLRVELLNEGDATVYRLFVDPETLPPEAPEELRSMTEPFPDMAPIPAILLAPGYEATVEWQPPGPPGASPLPIRLGYRVEPPQGGSFGLFLSVFVRSALEHFAAHMDHVLPFFDVSKQPPTWEVEGTLARAGVVALFDRTYGPAELIERRGHAAPPDRLTNGELAVTSILSGHWPSMPDNVIGWTVAEIIEEEARHMTTARKTLKTLRAAGFPVPRAFVRGSRIDLTREPPGV